MANDSVSVSGPITVKSDSRDRVTFDLMMIIDQYSDLGSEKKTKEYWLKLYHQCYKATNGHDLGSILKAV